MSKWIMAIIVGLFAVAPILLIYYVSTNDRVSDSLISNITLLECTYRNPDQQALCAQRTSDVAREALEVREERINRWLFGITGFLGLVTWYFTLILILIAIGGVSSFWEIQSLRRRARKRLEKQKRWLDQSEELHVSIQSIFEEVERRSTEIGEEVIQSVLDRIREARQSMEDISHKSSEIDEMHQSASASADAAQDAERSGKEIVQTLEELETEAQEIIDALKSKQDSK